MKKGLARLGELPGQLAKLGAAIEEARRGRGPRARARAVRTQSLRPSRDLQPESFRESRALSSGFVEFSGAQLLEATAGDVVELSDATGVRLTIKLGGAVALDVAAVVAAFRGARR